jgi:hypothetical protein
MNQLKYLVKATIRLLINTDKTRVYLALVLPSPVDQQPDRFAPTMAIYKH